ncbi:NUDIX domain-containing protein [Mesobaculum littorinae]|uniref:NUDIX domain-containing protein n=1 Tax=Mesobaculum littorinae TaxID=2486419 RepID=A0A438AHJ2_9RHOB|nr:NUDIX hydrolase [Mesobaculum littorinae]RVV98199.1 NUDIX domain-containing protein [Mesobaculum littorinae]
MTDAAFRGAKIAILTGAHVVALLRDDRPDILYPGLWDLPGGGREGDETPLACVLRETREETGLRLDPARIFWRRLCPGPNWFFAADLPVLDPGALRLGGEGQDLTLMPIAEFIDHPGAIAHLRRRLRACLPERPGDVSV